MNGTLTPAYGRDYKSKKALEEDLRAGKDFRIECMGRSTYCSIADLKVGTTYQFRYGKLRKVTMITV